MKNPKQDEREQDKTEVLLRTTLFRITCPDTDALINYIENVLPEDEKSGIEKHIAYCRHCAAELQKFNTARLFLRVRSESVSRSKWFPSFVARSILQPAAVRGMISDHESRGHADRSFYYDVPPLDWQITINILSGSEATFVLQGQLFGAPTEELATCKMVLVPEAQFEIKTPEVLPLVGALDQEGLFNITSVPADTYLIWLQTPWANVSLPPLCVR